MGKFPRSQGTGSSEISFSWNFLLFLDFWYGNCDPKSKVTGCDGSYGHLLWWFIYEHGNFHSHVKLPDGIFCGIRKSWVPKKTMGFPCFSPLIIKYHKQWLGWYLGIPWPRWKMMKNGHLHWAATNFRPFRRDSVHRLNNALAPNPVAERLHEVASCSGTPCCRWKSCRIKL